MSEVYCPCKAPIVKAAGETPKQYEKRLKSGFCRSKCKNNPKFRRGAITIETPTKTAAKVIPIRPALQPVHREFTGSFFKVIPEDDPKYLKWIRTEPCMIPGCRNKAESHHQNPEGDSAMGATCSDRRALPLCTAHHTGGGTKELPGSYHGLVKLTGRAFLKHYGIDPEKKIAQLNAEYEQLLLDKNKGVA